MGAGSRGNACLGKRTSAELAVCSSQHLKQASEPPCEQLLEKVYNFKPYLYPSDVYISPETQLCGQSPAPSTARRQTALC